MHVAVLLFGARRLWRTTCRGRDSCRDSGRCS